MKSLAVILSGVALAACASDIDEQWDLDHDRIIAVQVGKPGLLAGEQTSMRGLIGHKYDTKDDKDLTRIAPDIQNPIAALVVSPMSLMDTVALDGTITAPSDERIAAARTELGLAAGAPVPLIVGTRFVDESLNAITTVLLGVSAENPVIGQPMFNGQPAPAEGTPLVIDSLVDVPVSIPVDVQKIDTNWLTSVGQMHDFDLPTAYVRVEKDDPLSGSFAVVIRDRQGGVAWMVWPLTANPPPETPAP